MKYCNRLKKILYLHYRCDLSCIFWNHELQKCIFDTYYPGLKKGRDTSKEVDLEIGGA